MSYKIGSFNCLNFGLGATKDVVKFAQIIKDEQFDIIALQEIKGNMALQTRILSHLPSCWTGMADDGFVNDYAFIWNKNRVKLSEYQKDGITRIYKPHIYKQYRIDRSRGQMDLVREPYYARFIPAGGAAPFIEIRIINCHIRYSKGSSNSSADDQSLGAIAMRKNEFDVLSSTLYPKIANKRYGNNRPSYTILLGDYNLNMKSSNASSPYLLESIEIQEERMQIITTQDKLSTLRNPKGDNQPQGFANNYDHFTYDQHRFSDISVQCSTIDTVTQYYEGDFERHRKEISDHIPIAMDIVFKKG